MRIVVSNTYCVVVLFYLASSCVPYEDRVYFSIFEMVTSQKKLNSYNNENSNSATYYMTVQFPDTKVAG